jgi:hypothetical protein
MSPSIQSYLEESNIAIKRVLFDNQIEMMGKMTKALRLKIDEDRYGDGEIKIISKSIIECMIIYPGNVPLLRNRADATSDTNASQNIMLFDILPIDLYAKWGDNIERFDFIIDKTKDENGNYTKFILQVSDLVGTFRDSLQFKKWLCAPYNGPRTSDINFAVDTF